MENENSDDTERVVQGEHPDLEEATPDLDTDDTAAFVDENVDLGNRWKTMHLEAEMRFVEDIGDFGKAKV